MRGVIGVLLTGAVAAAAGCGGAGAGSGAADTVRVYSSFTIASESSLVRAQQLALADAGGRAGKLKVELVSLNVPGGANPATGTEQAEANSERAVSDERAVAYIGESNSDLTARSLFKTNKGGLLHVSPSATYTGFTKAAGAQPGEPAKFASAGRRTFGRVIPADDIQALGIVEAIRQARVGSLFILDDSTIYGTGLSRLVREAAVDGGVKVSEDPRILRAAAGGPAGVAKAMQAAGVGGVAFLGCLDPRVAKSFFDTAPELKLFTGDCQSKPDFYEHAGSQLSGLTIAAPFPDIEGEAARAFAERFEQRYGLPPDPQAYFAYEAMAVIIDSIERAGDRGDERSAVRDAFFDTRGRDGMVGKYSIDSHGDTTLRTVGLFRVEDRKLVLDRVITAP